MELVIDIGNSYTKVALINHERVIRYFPFKSNEKINLSKLKNLKFNVVLISSVVNRLTPIVIKEIRKISKAKIVDIAKLKKKIKIGVNCTTEEIGSDLYADLTAAKKRFNSPVLIFDIGTVNKVLALDKNNVFIGASFFSGLEGSARSMFHNTDKLPEIKLEYSNNFMGKTTISCINNGVLYSLAYSIEGFIKNYKKLLGKNTKVVITGGGASLIRPIIKDVTYYPYLTILGIYYIYLENK
ncbi:MAG: type III pantothenate kinase [Bacilli bacterium]|nr:type III pantothenate kinase [Bacilli bacterium]